MHDTDAFARMPVLETPAAQPPCSELLLVFEKEVDVSFKDELYRVRDNGAILRRARPQRRVRPLDEIWTFGTLNRHTGYPELAGHVLRLSTSSIISTPTVRITGPTICAGSRGLRTSC